MIKNGTTYADDTPTAVVDVLETYRAARERGGEVPRLRLYYGDPQTGRDWGETFDTTGYIGRSTGVEKVPLLIANSRSMGGGAILANRIVRIGFANRKAGNGRDLYRHPDYAPPVEVPA